jgi:transposase
MVSDVQVKKLRRLLQNGVTLKLASEQSRMSTKTAKKYLKNGKLPSELRNDHYCKTHKNPFDPIREEVLTLLKSKYNLSAKELFVIIQEKHPRQFSENQLRSFQRLVKSLLATRREDDFVWMRKLLHGVLSCAEIHRQLHLDYHQESIEVLLKNINNGPIRCRNRAVAVLAYLSGITKKNIASFLLLNPKTVATYISHFKKGGVNTLFDFTKTKTKKSDDPTYKEAMFSILHAPPSAHDFNRTSWQIKDIKKIMDKQGLTISQVNIRKIIRSAGYKWRKAKIVLTSNDPEYREKLAHIQSILSTLGKNDRFCSIDEFGPFAVKMKGGRRLVAPGEYSSVPQFQISKGWLIITAALELSKNQVTHFYSKKKNTLEMIKLLEILLKEYSGCRKLYLSWDAASWHASNMLYEKVDEVNKRKYRKAHKTPFVKLAPLPASAQFLNVIESIFSGMARAIIHNSNYASVAEAKKAIDRYFAERNEHFQKHPKKAGNKIWGKELVPSSFSEANNCKDPKW